MNGAFLRRRDRTARPPRVGHYSAAVNMMVKDDWESDSRAIVRKIIDNARNGNLEAVKFLLEHNNFELPDFKVNGD